MSIVAAIAGHAPDLPARGAALLARQARGGGWRDCELSDDGLWRAGSGPDGSVTTAGAAPGGRGALFSGLLLNRRALVVELGLESAASPAAVALAAWERWGTGLFTRLEGVYAVILHDPAKRHTIAGTDPRNVGQLHAVVLGDEVLFASQAKAFLADGRFAARLDHEALAELLLIGWVLDGSSLFAGVRRLPIGCHFEVADGDLRVVRHADDRDLALGGAGAGEYLEGMAAAISVIAGEAFDAGDVVFPLTGGLDARLVLAAMPRRARPFTFTFGDARDGDVRSAARLAARRGLAHEVIAPETAYLARFGRDTVWRGEGLLSAYDNQTGDLMSRFAGRDRFVSGSGGEGGRRHLRTTGMLPDRALLAATGHEFERRFVGGVWRPRIDRERLGELFGHTLGDELYEHGVARVREQIGRSDGLHAVDRLDLYFFEVDEANTRVRLIMTDPWVQSCAPFLSQRWVAAVLRGTPGLRIDDLTRIRLIRRLDPAVASVPWNMTRLPLQVSGAGIVAARGLSYLRRGRGSDAGHEGDQGAAGAIETRSGNEGPLMEQARHLKKALTRRAMQPDDWMQGPSRDFVEEVLLSPRAAERGLMAPDAVRAFVDERRTGDEGGRPLGLVLTLELWCRIFLDGEGP